MMRCACGRVIAGWCVIVTPEVDNACPQGDDECPDRRPAPLEAARRADADQCPHEEAQVEGACLDEQAFEDVRMPAHMRPPLAAGFVEMRVRPFEMFAPPPLQSQPRAPRMRRRLAYTASRATVFFFQLRRPRFGSAM